MLPDPKPRVEPEAVRTRDSAECACAQARLGADEAECGGEDREGQATALRPAQQRARVQDAPEPRGRALHQGHPPEDERQ